jgi:hypothetical protein
MVKGEINTTKGAALLLFFSLQSFVARITNKKITHILLYCTDTRKKLIFLQSQSFRC